MGTVAYMSPEQARAKELDARTDLFSFGAVLYEMATGTHAVSGGDSAVILGILDARPTPVRGSIPDVPAGLEKIINKALEKDRDLRYQHAAEMRTDLKRLKRDTDSHSAAISSASRRRGDQRSIAVQRSKRSQSKLASIHGCRSTLSSQECSSRPEIYYRSHIVKPLTDKDTVVLTDFSNSTGDAVFDDTLKTALSVALESVSVPERSLRQESNGIRCSK